MEIPGLGTVKADDEFGLLHSEPLPVAALGGRSCSFVLEGYEEDPHQEDFHAAVASMLSAGNDLLREATPDVFRYYEDLNSEWEPGDPEYVEAGVDDIWEHVRFGRELHVSRRSHGDHAVYVSVECNCDWEPEHGLQVVFKEGRTVAKVGPYDSHLTNVDAYGDPTLEGVVYKRR
jgi:hypothetical protein